MTITIDFPAVIAGLFSLGLIIGFFSMIYHLVRFTKANNRTCKERGMMISLCNFVHKYDKELYEKLDKEYRAVDYDDHLKQLKKFGSAACLYPVHCATFRRIFQ